MLSPVRLFPPKPIFRLAGAGWFVRHGCPAQPNAGTQPVFPAGGLASSGTRWESALAGPAPAAVSSAVAAVPWGHPCLSFPPCKSSSVARYEGGGCLAGDRGGIGCLCPSPGDKHTGCDPGRCVGPCGRVTCWGQWPGSSRGRSYARTSPGTSRGRAVPGWVPPAEPRGATELSPWAAAGPCPGRPGSEEERSWARRKAGEGKGGHSRAGRRGERAWGPLAVP